MGTSIRSRSRWLCRIVATVLLVTAVFALPVTKGTDESAYAAAEKASVLQWIKSYGGSKDDFFASIIQSSDGGYVAAGLSESSDGDLLGNEGSADFIIAKFDADGNKKWIKNHGGTDLDSFGSIIQTSDGGYAATGYGNYKDFVIAKFDAAGNESWIKYYGGSRQDAFSSIVQTSDGGYVAAGHGYSTDGDLPGNVDFVSGDFVIAKFDAEGNKSWINTYGGSGNDEFRSIIQTPDGGYVAVGRSWSSGGDLSGNKGYSDFVIAKFDSNGEKQWIKNYGGSEEDEFESIIQTSDGDYVAAGWSDSSDGDLSVNKGQRDFVIAKFDSAGNKTWINNYGGNNFDIFASIIQTSDGGYVTAGRSSSADGDLPGNTDFVSGDFVIAKFDSAGNKSWINTYGGSSTDIFASIIQTSGGNYVAAGWSLSSDGDLSGNKGASDFVVAKFTEEDVISEDLTPATVTPTQTSYPYDGAPKTPEVTVTLSGRALTKDTDYTITYSDNINAGTATITVTGTGDYEGVATAQFTITPADIAAATLTLAKTSYVYDGKAKTPNVSVVLNGATLVKGRDFTVSYVSNKVIGKAKATITGTGNYAGSKTASFKIVPKQAKIKKVAADKRSVKVTWSNADAKQKITGYQIQYRVKGKTKWSKPKSVSAKKLKYTIKALKKGKAYQIQVRAYKKVSGANYYGAWSKTKTSKKVK